MSKILRPSMIKVRFRYLLGNVYIRNNKKSFVGADKRKTLINILVSIINR